MQRRGLAQFCSEGVVAGFYFNSKPIKGLREPSGAELQAEAIAQDSAGFAHGKSFGLVEISSQGQGSWTKVHPGGPGGQGHL
jgi:hypothetical protein